MSAPLDTVALIETPEHVRFRYRLAGPARRAVAYGVDLMVRAVVLGFFGILLLIAGAATGFDEQSAGFGAGAMLTLFFLVEWFYFVLCEMLTGGRSVGKVLLKLRVVKQGGVPLSFSDSLLRNLLRGADLLPSFYALGLLVMTRDKSFRRLGDLVANTLVISEEGAKVSGRLMIDPPPTAQELARIPARPGLSAQEVEALELFISRYGTLGQARQEELAEIIAPGLAARLGLSYRSAARFLGLLYFRTTHGDSAPAPLPIKSAKLTSMPPEWHRYGA